MEKQMNGVILGIESSCDDSAVALFDLANFKLIAHEKITQEDDHAKYGGVVPELAARLHTAALPHLIEILSQKYSLNFADVRAVCVSNEPGLSVSLIGGVSMAKSLSLALNVPIIGVNHLIGHIYSLFLECESEFPMGVLLVSGGHTMVLDIDANGEISVLCATGDDSFGESFDKVAKMMGLGYPGGKIIENLAKNGRDEYHFTIPLLHDNRLEFSFSGLKNQVRLQIEKSGICGLNLGCAGANLDGNLDGNCGIKLDEIRANIACSFQNTAVAHILDKLGKIYAQKRWAKFGVVGGASANLMLRAGLEKMSEKYGAKLFCAPLKFCADNAAMIARAGAQKYIRGEFDDIKTLEIHPKSTALHA